METATHTTNRYYCETCNKEFTRQSSVSRHKSRPTACRVARRANGASTLGSSSSAQSLFNASTGNPSKTPHNAHDDIPLASSPTGPAPGIQQPPSLVFYPPSPTNPPLSHPLASSSADPVPGGSYPYSPANSRNTSGLNYSLLAAHAPSQPQAEAIAQSPLIPPLAGSLTSPAPHNRQPPVPGSYPYSLTNPQKTSGRDHSLLAAHAPSNRRMKQSLSHH